ncbi:hypothetical protein WJX73_007420 [Symbiochloris irregularis]|uniref:Rhodanese domain-containing protein n=1 Tax=Symbiochloris irregularis TaxID=706552 RepID=A0AAW1NVG0_9CHLO
MSNGAVSFEKEVDVESILSEASAASQDFVFEDNDDDSDVWVAEKNFVVSPPTEPASEPEVKGALDPEQADILSAYSSEQGFREIAVGDLRQHLDTAPDSVFVLDVRSAWEFSRGHIPGATNINMDDLSAKVKSGALDHVRDSTVAVICAAGLRSAQAAVRLHRVFGFQDVVNVRGGTTEWIKNGFHVDM